MSLFGWKEKKELELLKSQMPKEQIELAEWQRKVQELKAEYDSMQKDISAEISAAKEKLAQLKSEIVETDEAVLLQSSGIYTPRYSFMNSDEYRARLLEIRAKQKDMIKGKSAVYGSTNWTLNGSAAKGKKWSPICRNFCSGHSTLSVMM